MRRIPTNMIRPNPEQPRKIFDESALMELAVSIREHGLQNPILVEDAGDGTFTLVSGERRLRAFQMLNISEIPAIVRPPLGEGRQFLVDAMIENVQRESMTPVEEANGYRRMRDEFGMSVAEISRHMGISYNQVVSRLKITELENEIQVLVATKALPASQQSVDALLSVPAGEPRVKLAKALATRSATIRMVQEACARLNAALQTPKPTGKYAKTPAIHVGSKRARVEPDQIREEWDALYQVNRVPRWPVYVDTVQATCQACSLYPVASEATCRDCPLVDSVRRILQAVEATAS